MSKYNRETTTTANDTNHSFSLPLSLGVSNKSPKKKRSKRNNELVSLPLPTLRQKFVKAKLDRLRSCLSSNKSTADETTPKASSSTLPHPSQSNPAAGNPSNPPERATNATPDPHESTGTREQDNSNQSFHGDDAMPFFNDSESTKSPKKPRAVTRKTAVEDAEDTVAKWKALLPTLMDPLLRYQSHTFGKVNPPPFSYRCASGSCMKTDSQVHVYHFECGFLFISFALWC